MHNNIEDFIKDAVVYASESKKKNFPCSYREHYGPYCDDTFKQAEYQVNT